MIDGEITILIILIDVGQNAISVSAEAAIEHSHDGNVNSQVGLWVPTFVVKW